MANDGYMGKILRVDLTSKKISTIDTEKYKEYGGGHGIGSAIFWDECEDPTVDAFDPKNVVTVMTSPLSGTIAPAASGRTEVQGIGPQGYPHQWFTRSNFGGRFAGMLKYAGWDGIVIKGKADKPCWIDIKNDKVTIEDATGVWGLDTYETQEEIFRRVRESGGSSVNGWYTLEKGRDTGRSSMNPCVLAIGPIGESVSPLGALIHEGGNGAGQGGFGGVWGSKNLKAISVIGTGEVVPADMKALMDARLWAQDFSAGHRTAEEVEALHPVANSFLINMTFPGNPGMATSLAPADQPAVPYGCMACHRCCRRRFASGKSNGSSCVDYALSSVDGQGVLDESDMVQRLGFNVYPLSKMFPWLQVLNKKGILGKGKEIDTDLDFSQFGTPAFVESVLKKILNKEDIGAALHKGLPQGAAELGRYDIDTTTGDLACDVWGYPQHYDCRTEFEWGYGSLMGERDVNEHDFNPVVYWLPTWSHIYGIDPPFTAEAIAKHISDMCRVGGEKYYDPNMLDYSTEGRYSETAAKLVAWHRHYTRYYKQSMLFCDWSYADFYNPYRPDNKGLTGEAEPRISNAVTGKNISFEQGLEIGRKIWNLDRAIWCLEGRTADKEVYSNYVYDVPIPPSAMPYIMPALEDGKWIWKDLTGQKLDRQKVEDWKQIYYKFEGWNENGVPTRATLEELGLKEVADKLEKAGKL